MANGETGYLKDRDLALLLGASTRLRAAVPTAAMYERLDREGVRTGHVVDVAGPGGAYRSNADLHDIQAQWLGKAHVKNWDLNRGSGAMPSLYSVHGLGRCLDFTRDVAWVKQVSLDYGLTFPLVHLGDLNHGQHDGKTRGQADLLPYEVKRLARFLGADCKAATTGKRDSAYLKALSARVTKDDKEGGPRRAHERRYLDAEARAKAPR